MTMCIDCKNWDHDAVEAYGVGVCRLMTTNNGRADYPNSSAMARDAEGYHAEVSTRASFGCLMFEPPQAIRLLGDGAY